MQFYSFFPFIFIPLDPLKYVLERSKKQHINKVWPKGVDGLDRINQMLLAFHSCGRSRESSKRVKAKHSLWKHSLWQQPCKQGIF